MCHPTTPSLPSYLNEAKYVLVEKTLKALLTQQRAKIEDIKKKTNYYTTRNLIERYDDAAGGTPNRPGAGTPLRQRIPPGGMPATPQAQGQGASPQGQGQQPRKSTPQTPERPALQSHLTRTFTLPSSSISTLSHLSFWSDFHIKPHHIPSRHLADNGTINS